MNTQNDFYKLAAFNYLAPDSVIADMARDYSQAAQEQGHVRGDYLRVLIAHSQRTLPDAITANSEAMVTAIEFTHDRMYAIVLSAVTTPDIANDETQSKAERQRRSLERNRRSNFARSAKSTLIGFVKAGGALQGLRPAEVTKESLRLTANPPAPGPSSAATPNRLESQLEKAVKRLAEENREAAIDFIDKLHTRLMLIVAQPLTQLTTRRGEITLHPAH